MADSVYNQFYWDYAAREEIIEGYPAILVPIIMQEEINSSLVEGMAPKGYRVAVFQHDYDKNNIIVSFRDYHPYEQEIIDLMQDKGMSRYPSRFLGFYDLLGDEFSGHVIHLDYQLTALRITEVVDNKMIKYLNLPSEDPLQENPLIEHEYEEIFPVSGHECQVQIAYPDLEISYTTQRFVGSEPSGQVGSNLDGRSIYGMSMGMRKVGSYNLIWRTETIPTGGCSNINGANGFSNGIATYYGSAAGPPVQESDDCLKRMRINNILGYKAKLADIKGQKNSLGIKVEAGFNVSVKDLLNLTDQEISRVYNDNDQYNVKIPFTWNSEDGYVLNTTHFHTFGYPPSIQDFFALGTSAHMVANASGDKDFHKETFMTNYVDIIEIGGGEFYAITVVDMDKLILKTRGNSVDLSTYINNLDRYLSKYDKFLNGRPDSPELRINFLLDNFSDSIKLYKGTRDENGNLKKLDKLGYAQEGYTFGGIDC
ncbi:hypothetical protein [Sphingobacterium hungaricum]|nr:hypothetical protein [Sphingobacterium hungaricum]